MNKLLPDKILILAPHPDDELLLTGGIIARAAEQGAEIFVAVVTNGDYLCPTREKGENRLSESLDALRFLGVPDSRIYFLGYPDTGMEPEVSFLNRLYHSDNEYQVFSSSCGEHTYALPYHADYSFLRTGTHAPYTKNAFVQDLHSLITDLNPKLIITTSAYDIHGDHSALALFTREALRSLHLQNSEFAPILWEGIVHSPSGDDVWPVQSQDMQPMTMPPHLEQLTPLIWSQRISVPVPSSMLSDTACNSRKHKAIMLYKTAFQVGEEDVWSYLLSFAKKDECFWQTEWRQENGN